MRILVTNDDGIHAEGLEACEKIARRSAEEVWIVAPEDDQSGVSHSLSLNDPLRLRKIASGISPSRARRPIASSWACVICSRKDPDLVMSGVNRGRNVAED